MSGIPLPALDVKPPQAPDVMGDMSRLMAMRGMMNQQQAQQQEMQVRQQQIQDQQATTAAMKNWDGKDYDQLSKSVLQNGGSATAATAIQQHGLTIKKTVSDIAKQDAETGSKKLETFIGIHEAIGDALEGIENVPDEQLHAAAQQKVRQLVQGGIMDPQVGQQALQQIQQTQDPRALRDQIDQFAKGMMGAKAAAEQAKTEAETRKATAETGKATAETESAQATAAAKRKESAYYDKMGVGAPGVPTEAIQMSDWMSKNPGKGPSDYKLWVAQHSPTMLMQGGFGQQGDPMIDMVGQGRVDLATALQRVAPGAKDAFMTQLNAKYPGFNQGAFGIEKKETEAFTSGPQGQQLTAIDTARQHMQTFKDTAAALHNNNVLLANKVGNAIGMQFGNDATTNFQIARSAFAGEVGKAFAGANVAEGDRKELLDKVNSASSPAQLQGYADTADKLLEGKQTALKRSYEAGSQAKPNFGTATGGKIRARDPQGKLHEAPAGTALPSGWKLEQ